MLNLGRAKLLIRRLLRKVYLKATSWRYTGERFLCPICGGRFARMKPFTVNFYLRGELLDHYTENAICPGCYSQIRHRFICAFLEQHNYLLRHRTKLLHFAPEEGLYDFFTSRRNIDYTTCDLNPSKYPSAVKVDITDIGFDDATYDAIICNHVIEHIKDDITAIEELYRVLKPGGWALISVPIYGEKTYEDPSLDYEGRQKWYGIGEHMRLNGLDLESKLARAGFYVKVYSFDDIPGDYIDRTVDSPHMRSDKYFFFCKKETN